RLLDHADPQRAIVVCPAELVEDHPRSRHRRVRGFSAQALADPDVVIGAVRLDLLRQSAHRIELDASTPAGTVQQLSWELRHEGVALLLHQSAGRVRASRTRVLTTPSGPGLLLTPPHPGVAARVAKRA